MDTFDGFAASDVVAPVKLDMSANMAPEPSAPMNADSYDSNRVVPDYVSLNAEPLAAPQIDISNPIIDSVAVAMGPEISPEVSPVFEANAAPQYVGPENDQLDNMIDTAPADTGNAASIRFVPETQLAAPLEERSGRVEFEGTQVDMSKYTNGFSANDLIVEKDIQESRNNPSGPQLLIGGSAASEIKIDLSNIPADAIIKPISIDQAVPPVMAEPSVASATLDQARESLYPNGVAAGNFQDMTLTTKPEEAISVPANDMSRWVATGGLDTSKNNPNEPGLIYVTGQTPAEAVSPPEPLITATSDTGALLDISGPPSLIYLNGQNPSEAPVDDAIAPAMISSNSDQAIINDVGAENPRSVIEQIRQEQTPQETIAAPVGMISGDFQTRVVDTSGNYAPGDMLRVNR